jgi:hypothetical protein
MTTEAQGKTREINGHIYANHLCWLEKSLKMPFMPEGYEEEGICGPRLKAKLIVELPERKVEISEAEFDEAFGMCAFEPSRPAGLFPQHGNDMLLEHLVALKQKLFSKSEQG